ncbi:MAG: hypothetical protein ACXVJZ_08205, partial [Acidimicrobiia bacterium]
MSAFVRPRGHGLVTGIRVERLDARLLRPPVPRTRARPSGALRDRLAMQGETESALEGGWQSDARRVGDVVLRSAKPQSRTVIALLKHLESVGFDAAPRPIGDGFAPDGREQLAYIEGESPHPHAWSEESAWQLGAMVGRLH